MTKEELEKEAEEYADKQVGCGDGYYEWTDIKQAYLASAGPREKRIAELTDNIREVTRELEEERFVTEDLKKQIEKMKCCINDLVHLGEFNEYTDEEYLNYQVHEALKNAEQFLNDSEVEK